MSRTLRLFLALLSAWLALPASALDMEDLCENPPAGATCICSEPLQGASYNVNPIDTTAPLECGNVDTNNAWTSQAVTGTPVGRAYRLPQNVNGWIPIPSPSVPLPAAGTYTHRHISRWSDDADVPDQAQGNERRKLIHIRLQPVGKLLAVNQIEGQVDPFDSGVGKIFYGQISLPLDAGGAVNCNGQMTVSNPIGSRVVMDDCRVSDNAWCVFEQWMTGNFSTGNGVTFGYDTWVIDSSGSIIKHERAIGDSCNFGESVELLPDPGSGVWPINGLSDLVDSGWREVAYVGAWTSTTTNVVIGPPTELYTGGVCGDGSLDAGEACDDGDTSVTACLYGDSPPLTQVCSADCLDATVDCAGPTYCGDSVVQAGEGEQCDPPGASCDASCQTILSPPGQPAYMPWRVVP